MNLFSNAPMITEQQLKIMVNKVISQPKEVSSSDSALTSQRVKVSELEISSEETLLYSSTPSKSCEEVLYFFVIHFNFVTVCLQVLAHIGLYLI